MSPRIRLIFATNNVHKVEEIQAAIGGEIEVISLSAAGIHIDIPEPHDTLAANATEKSTTIHRLTGMNCFSEDTGLEVNALNGEPGVKSARYAGEDRAFEKNVEKLLLNLAAATAAATSDAGTRRSITASSALPATTDRRAQFRTVISLIWEEKEYLFEGICKGHILPAPVGEGGFGYDPVFVPEGDDRSFAEMSLQEKNKYSHRRKAADRLVAFLHSAVKEAATPAPGAAKH